MPSTYSTNLRVELQAQGENSAIWGDKANAVFNMLEQAISGVVSVTHDDTAAYTLTTANGSSDEARNMVVLITGTLTAARNLVVPTSDKLYVVKNATTGGYAVTVKTSGGSGISVANGETEILYCDATDVIRAQTTPTGTGAPVRAASPTFTGATAFAAGAAATPAIIPSGDANTGMWFPTADTIAWSTAGVERMRIDSSGDATITKAGADLDFHIVTTGGSGRDWVLRSDNDGRFIIRDGTAGLGRMEWDSTGLCTANAGLYSSGSLLVISATGLVGYGTGAGGTVTQATDKTTGVVLNKPCGQITMHNAALAGGATVEFALTNSFIAASDKLSLTFSYGVGLSRSYSVRACCYAGGAYINVKNETGGSQSEAVILNFEIIKVATS